MCVNICQTNNYVKSIAFRLLLSYIYLQTARWPDPSRTRKKARKKQPRTEGKDDHQPEPNPEKGNGEAMTENESGPERCVNTERGLDLNLL
ncbi:protein of unknown function [Hyphomicrobium sp. MC1]|nr:protein of unknown function [Hyphomicrobium sp. MC1]